MKIEKGTQTQKVQKRKYEVKMKQNARERLKEKETKKAKNWKRKTERGRPKEGRLNRGG